MSFALSPPFLQAGKTNIMQRTKHKSTNSLRFFIDFSSILNKVLISWYSLFDQQGQAESIALHVTPERKGQNDLWQFR